LTANTQQQPIERRSHAGSLGAGLRVTTTINDSSTGFVECIDPFKKQVEQVLGHRAQPQSMVHNLLEKARGK